jgi:hypothetical protein
LWIVQTHTTQTVPVPSQPSNITWRTGSEGTNTHLSTPFKPSCRLAATFSSIVAPLNVSNRLWSLCPRCDAVVLLGRFLDLAPHRPNYAHAGAVRRFNGPPPDIRKDAGGSLTSFRDSGGCLLVGPPRRVRTAHSSTSRTLGVVVGDRRVLRRGDDAAVV